MRCKFYRANCNCSCPSRKVFWIFQNSTCGYSFNQSQCNYFIESIKPKLKGKEG